YNCVLSCDDLPWKLLVRRERPMRIEKTKPSPDQMLLSSLGLKLFEPLPVISLNKTEFRTIQAALAIVEKVRENLAHEDNGDATNQDLDIAVWRGEAGLQFIVDCKGKIPLE